jgi:hypothetical protein
MRILLPVDQKERAEIVLGKYLHTMDKLVTLYVYRD